MKYFKEINLPKLNLYDEMLSMLDSERIHWHHTNQICLNTVEGKEDNFHYGVGSLTKDWDRARTVNGTIEVPLREEKIQDQDFNILCTAFKNTLFESIYNELKEKYNVGRVRLMKSFPHHCLSWHKDQQIRLHYPLKTQEGCFMIIEDQIKHLEKDKWFLTNTVYHHTAMNGSNSERIHLVVNVLEDYDDFKTNY